jgi:hypothetical protein
MSEWKGFISAFCRREKDILKDDRAFLGPSATKALSKIGIGAQIEK